MRLGFVAGFALTIAALGCSTPEAPAPPAPAPTATAAPAKPPRPSPAPPSAASNASPWPTLTNIVPPNPDGSADARRQETPCDRHEAGWKWAGTVVEDGKCVVGPCTCVQG